MSIVVNTLETTIPLLLHSAVDCFKPTNEISLKTIAIIQLLVVTYVLF